MFKAVGQEGMIVEEISTIKKKSHSLHHDSRKDTLRASQEWDQTPLRRKYPQDTLLSEDSLKVISPEFISPCSASQTLRDCGICGPKGSSYCLSWWQTLELSTWCWFSRHAEYKS
jgi:hypothetical protein